MDELTQQNAALVDGTTSMLQSAQVQIDALRDVVNFFRLSDRGETAQPDRDDMPEPALHDSGFDAGKTEPDPVGEQQAALARSPARRMSAGGSALAAADPDGWQEF